MNCRRSIICLRSALAIIRGILIFKPALILLLVLAQVQPYTNRLTTEKSPYLRLHANNPVDWYPWGEEAFAKARRENKPVLLSVGYSSCHWCHVMERESFSDPEIAEIMNRYFI